mmetsp:Transcript_693/g.2151  ORF Transcript_693/g.2151 Transcript_693/m.2151 type:complete len:205 (+) Transcript_693:1415-2029(+)
MYMSPLSNSPSSRPSRSNTFALFDPVATTNASPLGDQSNECTGYPSFGSISRNGCKSFLMPLKSYSFTNPSRAPVTNRDPVRSTAIVVTVFLCADPSSISSEMGSFSYSWSSSKSSSSSASFVLKAPSLSSFFEFCILLPITLASSSSSFCCFLSISSSRPPSPPLPRCSSCCCSRLCFFFLLPKPPLNPIIAATSISSSSSSK